MKHQEAIRRLTDAFNLLESERQLAETRIKESEGAVVNWSVRLRDVEAAGAEIQASIAVLRKDGAV
jgi:hypothetical protein